MLPRKECEQILGSTFDNVYYIIMRLQKEHGTKWAEKLFNSYDDIQNDVSDLVLDEYCEEEKDWEDEFSGGDSW